MRRLVLAVGAAVTLGALFGTTPAGARPGELTATLSCDRGVSATVAAKFVRNPTGGFEDLRCGPDGKSTRVVIATPVPETAIIVTQFDVESTENASCADPTQEVTIPARIDCGPKNGARLTVR